MSGSGFPSNTNVVDIYLDDKTGAPVKDDVIGQRGRREVVFHHGHHADRRGLSPADTRSARLKWV